MQKTFIFLLAFTAAAANAFSQDISGTWYGFQTSRDKGQVREYRITVDFILHDDSVTGTMTLIKADEKGAITSKFAGIYDPKRKTISLKELGVLTDGLSEKDYSLCEFSLKLDEKTIRGRGHAVNKGYDYLDIYLQRNANY